MTTDQIEARRIAARWAPNIAHLLLADVPREVERKAPTFTLPDFLREFGPGVS